MQRKLQFELLQFDENMFGCWCIHSPNCKKRELLLFHWTLKIFVKPFCSSVDIQKLNYIQKLAIFLLTRIIKC